MEADDSEDDPFRQKEDLNQARGAPSYDDENSVVTDERGSSEVASREDGDIHHDSLLRMDDESENEDEESDSESKARLMGENVSLDFESSRSSSPPESGDRETVRKMMFDEKVTLAASLSAAAKADIEKGKAIIRQRETFDSLLNVRIKLQKTLIAANSLESDKEPLPENADPIARAEQAAIKLWTSLTSLRDSMIASIRGSGNAQHPPLSSEGTSAHSDSAKQWQRMSAQDDSSRPRHRAILTKWSQRTNPITTLRSQSRFSQTPTQLPLTSMLDQQLSGTNLERALKKTQLARSCAPVQAASARNKQAVEDLNIYDDADFYTLMLRELVDRRMSDAKTTSHSTNLANGNISSSRTPDVSAMVLRSSLRDQKVKKPVDTKASKGRKMRYTVHEKLQNFMAPNDVGTWGERQREELFRSLLGRRVDIEMREDTDEDGRLGDSGVNDQADEDAEMGLDVGGDTGLRLF